jgi:hypothetical protein
MQVFNPNTKVSSGYMYGLIIKLTNNLELDIRNAVKAIQYLNRYKWKVCNYENSKII